MLKRKLTSVCKVVDSDWVKMNDYYKRIYPTLIDQLEKANNDATQKV